MKKRLIGRTEEIEELFAIPNIVKEFHLVSKIEAQGVALYNVFFENEIAIKLSNEISIKEVLPLANSLYMYRQQEKLNVLERDQ